MIIWKIKVGFITTFILEKFIERTMFIIKMIVRILIFCWVEIGLWGRMEINEGGASHKCKVICDHLFSFITLKSHLTPQ